MITPAFGKTLPAAPGVTFAALEPAGAAHRFRVTFGDDDLFRLTPFDAVLRCDLDRSALGEIDALSARRILEDHEGNLWIGTFGQG